MKDEPWQRDEIESPCVRVCVVHPEARICVGCHRTIDEIAMWAKMDPAARAAVLEDLPGRAKALKRRRGGRRARTERGGG